MNPQDKGIRVRIVLTVVLLLAMVSCGPPKPIILKASFDEVAAREVLTPGPNRITGSALIRQQGGGVVTCAGTKVILIPVTPYATERMLRIFGSDERGYSQGHPPQFEPDYTEYHDAMRKAVGDSQGMFEFDGVADGDYYVTTTVLWMVGGRQQGGGLMQRVRVHGGETKKIVLSPVAVD